MADETRDVLIDIQVEDKNADKAIGDLNKQLRDNRSEIKELSKDYEANSEQIARLERSNRDLTSSKRQLIKENQTQKGSLNELRLELAKQVSERNNLNLSTKEGSERFEELQMSIAGLNEEIGGFEQAGGDFRRNVGNYPQLLGEAAGGIRIFGTSLGDLFKLIVANPIGLLITALTGLVAIFKETQTGAEFFRKTGAALSQGLGLLSDIVESLGASLIEAFSNPKQALDDLVQTIKDGIVFYFNEFIPNAIDKVIDGFGLLGRAAKQLFEGDFDAALETATEGTVELLDGLTDLNPGTALIKTGFEAAAPAIAEFAAEVNKTVEAAFALEEQLIANEKAIADQEVVVAKSLKTQKELNLTIEDTTKAFQERIEAAEEFARVEQEQVETSIALQEERLAILRAQNELTNSTEEDLQRVRDAEIELANLQAASFERQVTNQNKLNSLRQAEVSAENAAREERFRAIDEEAQAIFDAEEAKNEEILKNIEEETNARRIAGQQSVAFARSGLDAVSQIAAEGSNIAKAAAVTQIGIDTATAISGGISAAQSVPYPFNLIAIASTIAVVLANINQARQILSNSGASSPAPSVSAAGAAPAAATQNVNAQLLSQFSDTSAGQAQSDQAASGALNNLPPIEVSVVEITSAQNSREVTVNEATLG
jgi:hypothetical protein